MFTHTALPSVYTVAIISLLVYALYYADMQIIKYTHAQNNILSKFWFCTTLYI